MIRVLIADDEGIERMALCRRLAKHFGDTLCICQAEDGAEAVELFKREKSQIVIMDIAMPVLNGVEAAEQIRRLDEGCVIIFLTAYDEFSYAKRALVCLLYTSIRSADGEAWGRKSIRDSRLVRNAVLRRSGRCQYQPAHCDAGYVDPDDGCLLYTSRCV